MREDQRQPDNDDVVDEYVDDEIVEDEPVGEIMAEETLAEDESQDDYEDDESQDDYQDDEPEIDESYDEPEGDDEPDEDIGEIEGEAQMRDMIGYIARALVDEPDAVEVRSQWGDGRLNINLKVADADKGKVIGRRGRVVHAMQSLLRVAATKSNMRAGIDVE